MRGNKEIERLGMKILRDFIVEEFSDSNIEWASSAEVAEYGCDLIFSANDKKYYIELKASGRHPYKDNLRMTPSTISRCSKKGVLNELIIALVTGVYDENSKNVVFIPFSSIAPDKLFVDVKFGFKPHHNEHINFKSVASARNNLSNSCGIAEHLSFTLAEKLGM